MRTFFIKAKLYGTAFTIDWMGAEYLITAKHLLEPSSSNFELQIFHQKQWRNVQATVVGHGNGEVDISALRINGRLTPVEYVVTPTMGGISLGQDVFFLGFPYKLWGDDRGLLSGLPIPFVKKGVLSWLDAGPPQVLHIDAINNEGFSGGPLVFFPPNKPTDARILGVVSKFRIEHEAVLDKDGQATEYTVPYNSGFLIGYGINHALQLIGATPGQIGARAI